MLKNKKLLSILLMGLLPAVALILISYIGSFTRYMADDYCSTYWAQRFGLFRSVWYWYINWSGRFSAYTSDWFVTLIGAHNVHFIPPVAMAIWLTVTVFAIYLFLKRLEVNEYLWEISLLLGMVFLFTLLLLMPNIQQSFYWWNGMRSYSLPLILLTLYAALFQFCIDRLNTNRTIILASLFSLAYLFLNAGLSDTFAVTQFSLLSFLAFWKIIIDKKWDATLTILVAGILGTALALVVIIVAPGNAAREATFPTHPLPLDILVVAWQGTLGHGMSWVKLFQSLVIPPENAMTLVGTILITAWVGSIQYRLALRIQLVPPLAVMGMITAFIAFLPASWGTSGPPPTRAISVPLFALITTLFLISFIAGNWLSTTNVNRAVSLTLLVLAITTINVSAAINIQKIYQSRETYIIFAERWDISENQILTAKALGQKSVTVTSWPNWADLNMLSDSPKNWLNVCTSGYYGIQVIGQTP